MRFSLQDVRKQVQRRNGELYVSLHFLHPGELHAEIECLIAYYEQHIGEPQRQFSLDDARACVGDYRLANCLIATLSAWYDRRQANWAEALQQLSVEDTAMIQLEVAGITSPIHLRLALFDHVNERHHGFLDSEMRTSTLQTFAALYHLSIPNLEYLLALNSDEEALLVRDAPQPPSVQQVATLYNQWAFEAALFNASSVHFVIDCNAFGNMPAVGARFIAPDTNNIAPSPANNKLATGVGAIIKRLCYLARRLGVYYDLAYDSPDETTGDGPGRAPTRDAPTLHLTLYGPQEMTGVPQQYGLRLARLCRMLLGYSDASRQDAKGEPGRGRQHNKATLTKAIVEAEATVHFLQRSYRFVMDSNLLKLLPSPETNQVDGSVGASLAGTHPDDRSSLFDSSIEQSFAEAFGALENSQGVDGWRLEREPEPLLLEQGIFIPDFALTRTQRRIYVEILGFWTPAYRERKLQKLHQLQERDDLLLAIPEEARNAFASIAASFPIVWYDGQLSASELLNVLRSRYDDFAERLQRIDVAMVRERVESEGLLPERACYELLHCYRRSELQRAAERVVGEGIVFVPGIGLYQEHWMERLRRWFVESIGAVAQLPLADVLRESRARWSVLVGCEDSTVEALLSLWPEIRVRRCSIFEAVVQIVDEDAVAEVGSSTEVVTDKGQRHERRTIPKKRVVRETKQADLWG